MDFSLTHLIVLPVSNAIPTTGSTQDLVAGKVGVFRPDYSVATAGNAAAAKYLYIGQGRAEKSLPTLLSDKIAASKISQWTLVTGSATYSNQITDISGFTVECNQDVAITFRLDSYYIRGAFFNGLTRSFVVKSPCCDCGVDPCTQVDNEAMIDLIIAKANEDFSLNREAINLNQFLTFEKVGTGAGAILRVAAKDLTKYGPLVGDTAANPFMQDRLSFKTFVTEGPDSMSDFETVDRCAPVANVAVTQRATYPRLTSNEVKQLEKDYYSYKVSSFKELYRNPGYNPFFESYVTDGVVYDQYLVQFYQYDNTTAYNDESIQDERVMLFIPSGEGSDIKAVLAAAWGSPADVSGPVVTTTTTTSTSTTTSTTTTTLIP